MGVGLSIDELSKDCVQRGALEAVVRRRPDIAAAGAVGQGWLGRRQASQQWRKVASWQLMP